MRGAILRVMGVNRLTTLALFLPPALLLFTLFVALPMIDAAGFAGYRWNGFGVPEDWVGTQNFELMARHSTFRDALANTGLIVASSVLLQIPIALALALMIYEKSWSNTVFRLIFFLPFIMAEVATGLIWSFFFDGDFGVSAMILRSLGFEPAYPLADPDWALAIVLFVLVWKYFGFHMMIFIAALQSISKDLVDAARIDGAGPWRLAWQIKIPLLKPALAASAFLAVIGSLKLFDLIMPITGGGPSHTTHSLATYLYTFGLLRMKIGYGSAVGLFLFVLSVVCALLCRRALRQRREVG